MSQLNHQYPNREQHLLVPSSDYNWVRYAIGFLVVCNLLSFALGWMLHAPAIQRKATQVEVQQQGGQVVVVATATPGAVPTPVGVVREYKVGAVVSWQRTVSRLETKEYDIQGDVVKARQGGAFNIGGESIQSHLVGTIIGRVDLSGLTLDPQLRQGDITVSEDGTQISIVLPYPQVANPIVDESQSSFNGHTIGWFTSSDPNLWQAARKEASEMLVAKACEQNILEKARLEAEAQVKAIFSLGFKQVFVQTRPATVVCGLAAK